MILLWGLPGDGPLSAVRKALERCNAPYFLLDQQQVLHTALELFTGETVYGNIRAGSACLSLDTITAAYLRPCDARLLAPIQQAGSCSCAWRHAISMYDGLQTWAEVTEALVINRPSAMASTNSKPYQSTLIRAASLDVPATIVTNDEDAVREFWETYGVIVHKSSSGTRDNVLKLTAGDRQGLKDLMSCPTQFQEYIEGIDYRVTVVGDRVFSSEIVEQAGTPGKARACRLEPALEERCLELAASLGLLVAGIDLRRTAKGRWYCFEVNPSPDFTVSHRSAGQPVDSAIADLLTKRQHDPLGHERAQVTQLLSC